LPLPPVHEVSSISYFDGTTFVTLDPSRYVVDLISQPARIFSVYGTPWPMMTYRRPASVVVDFVAGYEPDAVPKSTIRAMCMIVAGWYAQREHITEGTLSEIPAAANALLDCDVWGGQIV
jgi:uncharacterized phiE125 gp8 family phage protein